MGLPALSDMTVNEYISIFLTGVGIVSTLVTVGWVSASFMNKKFSGLTEQIDTQMQKLEDNLIRKMDYHEKHDDDRFSQVRNDIWEIRLHNAAHDGKIDVSRRKPNPDN